MKRAIIFANGQLTNLQQARTFIQPDDYIIAADGGAQYVFAIGINPHVIIGDLDSLPPEEKAQAEAAGVHIRQFSPHKDETDLELALRHAVDQNAAEIIILGALGGQIDHLLGNVLLLTLPELAGRIVQIVDDLQTIFLIRDEVHLTGKPGDMVSILPLGGAAVGVSNEGFQWPLHDETLPIGSPRGLRNVLLGAHGRIGVRQGLLLCLVTSHIPAAAPPIR